MRTPARRAPTPALRRTNAMRASGIGFSEVTYQSTTAAGITPTCAKAELRSPCLSAMPPNASGWPTFWRSSNPVHRDDGTETGTAPVSMGAEQGEYAPAGSSQVRAGAQEITKDGEQILPVGKEELAVGKRASERHYRIRTYVVETPIE